ncbi:DUF3592 domain-containing protein [uncultured Roseibium sp.]|uniref:DUF3592 domain-containing protein n=1 Tax=uncultured Roseibium sp. TaxID=1936171 RepID=UPI0032174D08
MIDYLFYGANALSCIALLLIGISVVAWNYGADMLAFEKRGVPTTAQVLRKYVTRTRRNEDTLAYDYSHYVEYEYRTPQGDTVRENEYLSESDWDQAPEEGPIEILYLPEDPKKSCYKIRPSSSLFRFSGGARKGAYGAGILTVVGYLFWYGLAMHVAKAEVVIPDDWRSEKVEIYRKMPSQDLIDRLGLGRVEVSFFIELEPGETGEVPQSTRKLDKELAKTIEIGDVLEARYPPDNKWGAVLTIEAASKSD